MPNPKPTFQKIERLQFENDLPLIYRRKAWVNIDFERNKYSYFFGGESMCSEVCEDCKHFFECIESKDGCVFGFERKKR